MSMQAVITADIVNSTALSTSEGKRLKEKFNTILKDHRFEYYRGDSFQVLIKQPGNALTTVLQLRSEAKKIAIQYDIRCSIGIGEVKPSTKKLSTASDAAFIISGRAFDSLTGVDQRLIITSPNQVANHGLKVLGHFIDYLFAGLTEKQAEVINELLRGNTQLAIAKKLRRSPSTINKHAQTAGWQQIQLLLSEYDQLISIVKNGNALAH